MDPNEVSVQEIGHLWRKAKTGGHKLVVGASTYLCVPFHEVLLTSLAKIWHLMSNPGLYFRVKGEVRFSKLATL